MSVNSLVHLENFEKADAKIGDIDQYRQSEYYSAALTLRAEIDAAKTNIDDAVRSLLRVYYLPKVEKSIRLNSLLRTSEILIENDRILEAKNYFRKIKPNQISESDSNFVRYQKVKEQLALLDIMLKLV